jgi:hypothetical protein
MNEALWSNVRSGAWYLTRRLRGASLEIRNALTGQTVRARRGTTTVRINGEPGELLLYLFGRQAVAEIEFDGPTSAIELVRTARIGL